MIAVVKSIKVEAQVRRRRIPQRLSLAAGVFCMLFAALLGRAAEISMTNEPQEAGPAKVERVFTPRRDVVDRNGFVLATSVPLASLYADPYFILDPTDAAHKLHSVFPHLDPVKLAADLASDRRFVWIDRHLSPEQQEQVHQLYLPGVSFAKEYQRIYPQGSLASHVLGHVDADGNGLAGVELAMNDDLVDESAPGPLALSIDVTIQHALEAELAQGIEEFRAKAGSGVVLDSLTGEVLALASAPTFDANRPVPSDQERYFNRPVSGVYELGSVFKILNTAIALETNTATHDMPVDARKPLKIGKHVIKDFHAKNRVLTVSEVFKYSSNIGSTRLALDFGKDHQRAYFEKFGLMDRSSIELREAARPLTPSRWGDITTATLSYGYGLSISPLQLAEAIIPVVNGGLKMEASLLKGGRTKNPERVLSPETSYHLRNMMRMVVEEGTGKRADVPGIGVIGKTGTAERAGRRGYAERELISSFVGAFPAAAPRYVVYMVLEGPEGNKETHGYATAGWVAAPLVSRVVSRMSPILGIRPEFPDQQDGGLMLASEKVN
jgi:cell division protein FtsI (penicillin-binding protein 3)